jgi:PAS domain S-box-containing protein
MSPSGADGNTPPEDDAAPSAGEPTHPRGLSKENARWLRSVAHPYSEILAILGADATIRYVSPEVEQVLGYGPDHLIGTSAFDHVHPEDTERASRSFVEILETDGVLPPVELRARAVDGSWRHMEVVRHNLLDDPSVGGIVTNARDLTERKRAEEEIRFQSRLLDAVGQAVIATDSQGEILYWNRAAERLYGWSAQEVIGRPIVEITVTSSEELAERAKTIMSELRAGRSWSGEFEVRCKDGTSFPAMITNTPVHDEQETLVAIIGVSTDITELKKVEELRRSEERFRELIENLQVGMLLQGAEAEIMVSNRAALQLLGLTEDQLLGKSFFDLDWDVIHEDGSPFSSEESTPCRRLSLPVSPYAASSWGSIGPTRVTERGCWWTLSHSWPLMAAFGK